MGFLEQLKHQAQEVQSQRGAAVQHLDANVEATEQACQTLWRYLADLSTQLNIIQPPAFDVSLDGRNRWPPMKLTDFRFDARKALIRQREVIGHLTLGWQLQPHTAAPERGSVSVNFPPDLARVESRLRAGQVKHERLEQRHPDTRKLQAVVFEHDFVARAGIVFTADHDQARFQVHAACLRSMDVAQFNLAASDVTTDWLDDMAKAILGQPSPVG